MPSRPDFRLYHSNALDVLAGLLARELRTPAPGQALLAPDVVLIPQVAMRRWLQATLAQAHGIAANLKKWGHRSDPGLGLRGPAA